MLRNITLIALFSVILFSCEDSNAPETIEEFGTIVENPTDFQECGWLMNIDGVYHKASYLPNQYEIQDLQVRFTYVDLGRTVGCQNSTVEVPLIRLEQIRPN